MKKFDADYLLLNEMYEDPYFPEFLVDKVKALILPVISLLETGETALEVIQEHLDTMTRGINDLCEEFEENDSEIETVARDSIARTVIDILAWFHIEIDIEDALAQREW